MNMPDRILKTADRILEGVSTAAMTGTGYLSSYILSFTISRVFLLSLIFPLYLCKLALSLLPTTLQNSFKLLTRSGWTRLVQDTDEYRTHSASLAESQLDGSYRFQADEVFHIDRNSTGWMSTIPWTNDTREFTVCGATVRYIHLKPSYSSILQDGEKSHRPIVFLHGNPSWSYMWRNVFPRLLERGHEVYALDWLGHGRSDKILCPRVITFELHVRTLVQFFETAHLQHAILAAHNWGGCVALSTLPRLPPGTCDSLFLLNTFFPQRLSDASLHDRLLNRIWWCTTDLLAGYLPESAVVRFMSPQISEQDVIGYSAPYRGLPKSAKSSIYKFCHITPSLPRVALRRLRAMTPWKVIEGICGPSHFDNVNAQARMSALGDNVRGFWGSKEDAEGFAVLVAFGDKDPVIRDYKHVLVHSIHPDLMAKWASKGLWIAGAGHSPAEDRPGEVADLVARFARCAGALGSSGFTGE